MSDYQIINADCSEHLKFIPDNSIDLIFTSPPYANRRKRNYDSHTPVEYIKWFIPIAWELKRVLSDTGSFFLNIKAHSYDGERDLYVMKLVIALKEIVDFKFVDEYAWVKNPFPAKFHGKFKNGFEPIYHFVKGAVNNITFNPLVCGTSMKTETLKRINRNRHYHDTMSGLRAVSSINLDELQLVRPSNVLNINNVSNQFGGKRKHPATFPVQLADFFIKTFSREGYMVLDPFMGSGTTGISALNLGRKFIGIDNKQEYCELSKDRISKEVKYRTLNLFEINH